MKLALSVQLQKFSPKSDFTYDLKLNTQELRDPSYVAGLATLLMKQCNLVLTDEKLTTGEASLSERLKKALKSEWELTKTSDSFEDWYSQHLYDLTVKTWDRVGKLKEETNYE